MHFLFGILVFIFILFRFTSRWGRSRMPHHYDSYTPVAEAFDTLAAQHGGETYQTGWRKLLYVTQDRSVELQYNSDSRRLTLRLRKTFSSPFSFYRVPRLAYAFLEAYLRSSMKVEGTHYLIGSSDAELVSRLNDRPGLVPLLQKMDQAGFSGQVTRRGLKLWKTVRQEDLNDVSMATFIRWAQDLAHLCDTEAIHIPIQRVSSENRCAYCKELLVGEEAVQYCQWCGTPHHKDCFQLNGKCSVFGCERPVPEPASVRL